MFNFSLRKTPAIILTLLSAGLWAASSPSRVEPIQVTGFVGGVRDDSNTRVYGRDMLERFGDDDLVSALRRLPGVLVDTTPGQDMDDPKITLRGMGIGYTRVTLDGLPLGALGSGVSLDSFSLDRVERIEIRNGGDARESGEAVAGTLNIVLRENAKNGLALKLGASTSAARAGKLAGLEYRDSSGSLSWQLIANLKQTPGFRNREIDTLVDDPWGEQPSLIKREHWQQNTLEQTATLSPSLRWREGNELISLKWLADYTHWDAPGFNDLPFYQADYPAYYAWAQTQAANMNVGNMLVASWQHRLADGGKFYLDLALHHERSRDQYAWRAFDPDGQALDPQGESNHARQMQRSVRVGWDVPVGHGLNVRWGGESQRENAYSDSLSPEDDEPSVSNTWRTQTGLFAQLAWRPDAPFNLSAGIRREQTEQGPAAMLGVRSETVWLPSLTLDYWLDAAGENKLHLNLSRSNRPPRMRDLRSNINRSSYNQAYMPDTAGNPLLQSEIARGLELGVASSHFTGIDLSANFFMREIDRAIQPVLSQGEDQRWLLKPYNLGNAKVKGLELASSIDFERIARWPVQLHAAYSLYRSALSEVPGPYNSLANQPPAVLNLGLDYAPPQLPLEMGVNFNFQTAYTYSASHLQTMHFDPREVLDVYAQWKFSKDVRLKLSLANALQHSSSLTSLTRLDWGGVQHDRTVQHDYRTFSMTLETRF